MTRQQAKELWDRWQWLVAVILLPLVLWAAKSYDGSKVNTHDFALYVQQQDAARVLHAVRDSARQEHINRQLRYIACRVDHPRSRCLDP